MQGKLLRNSLSLNSQTNSHALIHKVALSFAILYYANIVLLDNNIFAQVYILII